MAPFIVLYYYLSITQVIMIDQTKRQCYSAKGLMVYTVASFIFIFISIVILIITYKSIYG